MGLYLLLALVTYLFILVFTAGLTRIFACWHVSEQIHFFPFKLFGLVFPFDHDRVEIFPSYCRLASLNLEQHQFLISNPFSYPFWWLKLTDVLSTYCCYASLIESIEIKKVPFDFHEPVPFCFLCVCLSIHWNINCLEKYCNCSLMQVLDISLVSYS